MTGRQRVNVVCVCVLYVCAHAPTRTCMYKREERKKREKEREKLRKRSVGPETMANWVMVITNKSNNPSSILRTNSYTLAVACHVHTF